MDLIELADELSMADIAEIFARKMLAAEQAICKARLESPDLDEEEKADVRVTLSTTTGLGSMAMDGAFHNWLHHGEFSELIDDAIDRIAEEYIRTF